MRKSPVLLRVHLAGGFLVVRTFQPARMIRTMKKKLMKCCQASQAGNPTGAPAGSSDLPG